jgi:hypothetical protein
MSPLIIRLRFASEMDLWANYSVAEARNLWPFLNKSVFFVNDGAAKKAFGLQ